MIKKDEYAKRRQTLMQTIGPEGIVILPAANEVIRNGDSTYPFRQNSDFYYLTGFNEPDAVLVLAPNRKGGEYLLFNRVRDRAMEIWNGPRAGLDGARQDYLADEAFPISQFELLLPELIIGRKVIHYPLGLNKNFDRILLKAVNKIRAKIRTGVQPPIAFADVGISLHEMRLFKSPAELATIQKAIDITQQGHVRAMQICQPGMMEYELEAALSYEFKRLGARRYAYDPIVGTGGNTCILHYVETNQQIADGDLVLIDAGAEYENYAADITRTFPANGRFSAEQRDIYELVLAAQLAAISSIKPGASWSKAQDIIVKIFTQGLIDLKILQGDVDTLIEQEAYFQFYMHRSGHWLGLDVHDVGRYKIDQQWRELMPGMVFTVEPGLYLSADIKGLDKRWHNIGVRIEDNVVVTESGYEVLSAKIPKTVAEMER